MGYADVEKSENGYLVDIKDWNEDIAREIAATEDIPDLTQRHWDVINYLREEFLNHGGEQPNDRTMVKAMGDLWDEKISAKELYALFPKQPSKQAAKIGGLPESKRKGGY